MSLTEVRIGFGLTGSHCTVSKVIPEIERLVRAGAEVFPILSSTVADTDTRFGKAEDLEGKYKKYRKKWRTLIE